MAEVTSTSYPIPTLTWRKHAWSRTIATPWTQRKTRVRLLTAGEALLAWIHYQNFLVPVKSACAPFGTLTAWCKRSRSFIGMASIVADDRGVRERYHLGGNGMWGGVIVPARLRRRGIGSALVSELDARCQAHAVREKSEACFLLFTEIRQQR